MQEWTDRDSCKLLYKSTHKSGNDIRKKKIISGVRINSLIYGNYKEI
jgi:hypothetical protein